MIRGDAVPIGVLQAVHVDGEPSRRVRTRQLGRLAHPELVEERLAAGGPARDEQAAALAGGAGYSAAVTRITGISRSVSLR